MKNIYLFRIFLLFAFLLPIHQACAEIYKKVDENGHVTYSNVPIKGASKLNLEANPPSTGGSSSAKTPTPTSFPKVDNKTQTQRDDKRKAILQAELEEEQKALAEAQKAYDEGSQNPEMVFGAGGKRFRNMAKYQEKMERLQADVDTHKRNIELLEKELANL